MGGESRTVGASQSSNKILAQMSADVKESGTLTWKDRFAARHCYLPGSVYCLCRSNFSNGREDLVNTGCRDLFHKPSRINCREWAGWLALLVRGIRCTV